MYFKTLLASAALLIASVTAQSSVTPTTSSPASTTTDLLGLVSQLPTCALGCLDEAATNINCTAPDLTCLCSKSSALVSSIGPCLLLSSGCSSNDTNSKSLFLTLSVSGIPSDDQIVTLSPQKSEASPGTFALTSTRPLLLNSLPHLAPSHPYSRPPLPIIPLRARMSPCTPGPP